MIIQERLLATFRKSWTSLLLFLLFVQTSSKETAHSRQKRILWITSDGRLALPPGTTMIISPSLSLPFVRYPPDGFFSNLTISLPFTIDFNKLGLTDNENPYGVLPPLLARSMGRAAGGLLGDYIGRFINHHRGKRSTGEKEPPELPHEYKNAFHGGERALLYLLVEDFLENFGMNGRACLLRAICEVNAHPLHNFGLMGEMMRLFFTASKSPFAELLLDYVEAEKAGRGVDGGPAECWPYLKDCPKSLFESKHHMYSEPPEEGEDVDLDNEILNGIREESAGAEITKKSKVTFDPTLKNM